MIRLLARLIAWYHSGSVALLLEDRRYHMRHGADEAGPYLRGLDYCIHHHDQALARLGYLRAARRD